MAVNRKIGYLDITTVTSLSITHHNQDFNSHIVTTIVAQELILNLGG
jgi:hypothetical protein